MSLGTFIRETREALGLTGRQLSQRAGCAPPTLSKIEHDKARPTMALLCRLFAELELVHTRGPADAQPVDLPVWDRAMLNTYHSLDEEGQAFVRTVLRREAKRCEVPRGIPILGTAVDLPTGMGPCDHSEK